MDRSMAALKVCAEKIRRRRAVKIKAVATQACRGATNGPDFVRRVAEETGLPVLVVRGLKSDVVSDAGIASFRAIVPHLEVADVGGAGHMVAGDRNDAFNDGVIAFLQRHMPVPVAP